ncbi:hypothetical protein EVAR_19758_1 [Eumeta japonica]|uniref:Uncharacterized protein n=1 Tax=Eumeta variegata TaxID=151549 RepID=A0A4C1URS4_EUMVA|nr:hypothetical protein EVAR_19758_1 [Eumeta japonica]
MYPNESPGNSPSATGAWPSRYGDSSPRSVDRESSPSCYKSTVRGCLTEAMMISGIDQLKYNTNTVRRTELCRSELPASDAMRRFNVGERSFLSSSFAPRSHFTPLRRFRDYLHSGRVSRVILYEATARQESVGTAQATSELNRTYKRTVIRPILQSDYSWICQDHNRISGLERDINSIKIGTKAGNITKIKFRTDNTISTEISKEWKLDRQRNQHRDQAKSGVDIGDQ